MGCENIAGRDENSRDVERKRVERKDRWMG